MPVVYIMLSVYERIWGVYISGFRVVPLLDEFLKVGSHRFMNNVHVALLHTLSSFEELKAFRIDVTDGEINCVFILAQVRPIKLAEVRLRHYHL